MAKVLFYAPLHDAHCTAAYIVYARTLQQILALVFEYNFAELKVKIQPQWRIILILASIYNEQDNVLLTPKTNQLD